MAVADAAPARGLGINQEATALAAQLRRLTRVATAVALLTSPPLVIWLDRHSGWPLWAAILGGLGAAIAFRGLVDVAVRSLVPWPSLFGIQDAREKQADVVSRRRAWFWRSLYKRSVFVFAPLGVAIWALIHFAGASALFQFLALVVLLPFYLLFNFAILFGPLMLVGVTQMRGYEPGDADWGVHLDDVRGQAEAKEEVRKIVTLWQSGEVFERAGGKRERGLLFHGPPGTGKTMLAKAIATSFNAPFISMPGSGFAQTFIGMDAVIVRWLARKAKRLARKWGGQCIVFVDEIDAVGMRRASLQGAPSMTINEELAGLQRYYGPFAAATASGDVVVESAAWRDHLFAQRAPGRRSPYPGWALRLGRIVDQAMPGGMFGMGGQLALNQLLVVMDGLDSPPFLRRVVTSAVNKLLDASYVVPTHVRGRSLRLRPPRPRKEQIYFIGATNVPLQNLDPALTRPGRMGRHVWFRTPTKDDRKDIFDLYLEKVAHDDELDTPKRRDEIARITNGYSPAMIDQVCSMALTYAHHNDRTSFTWADLLEAMSVIESGNPINVRYVPHETRAVAIHEAGHAAAAHVYRPEVESSRVSIRMRPGGSLGHHQSFEREERFTKWHREYLGELVHVLGAMAAERVFYGENAGGVSGDLETSTATAAVMAGILGMGPAPFEARFADETPEQTRQRLLKRFEEVGLQLMNRTRGSADAHADPIASIMRDPTKRSLAAQILGQAYVIAENFIRANRDKVEAVAERVIQERELYGDELVELLDAQRFEKPEIDWTKEETWPML